MIPSISSEDSDEQLPLLSKSAIRQRVETLAISADAKALLLDLADQAVDVGGKLIQVGRKILSFVFDLVQRFPNTTFGTIIGLVLTLLVSAVPIVGALLGALLGPLLIALGVGAGALADLKGERAFVSRVQRLENEFLALSAKA